MSESSARLSAVVDTNVFVSGAISPPGAPRRLLRALFDQRFRLLLSDQHYNELTEVLTRPRLTVLFRFSADELARLMAELSAADRVTPSATVLLPVRDPKDVMILAAALGGDADYLVTGDADLLVHRDDASLGTLRIVTVTEFLAILDQTVVHWGDEQAGII